MVNKDHHTDKYLAGPRYLTGPRYLAGPQYLAGIDTSIELLKVEEYRDT